MTKTKGESKPSKLVTADPAPPDPRTLRVTYTGERSHSAFIAELAVSPHVNAMMTVAAYAQDVLKRTGVTELADELKSQVTAVRSGNLSRPEAMLVAQAHSLDAIFTELARRAALNLGEYIGAAETYLKLALRAQSQCRATLETLATIKNPPVVFAKQANIANGPQQVNNNTCLTHADEIKIPPTELLEHDDGKQWLDTRTARKANASDPAMAAVGAINRPSDRARKGRGKS